MMDVPVQAGRRSFQANPEAHSTPRSDEERFYLINWLIPRYQEKPLASRSGDRTVNRHR